MTQQEPPPRQQVPRHVRTRRNLWLSANPSYFEQANHALSLPLAYDRLVRVYQTAAERQSANKRQGWARMLEGALVRGEARRDQAVKEQDRVRREDQERTGRDERQNGVVGPSKSLKALPEEVGSEAENDPNTDDTAASLDDEKLQTSKWDIPLGIMPARELLETTPEPTKPSRDSGTSEQGPTLQPDHVLVDGIDKTRALNRWHELLRARFVAGDDEDVDYAEVDRAGELEDKGWQESKQQDEWFEAEMESWSDDGTERGKKLEGETGIQDF